MQYHPSRGWLERNGHDVRLAKKVHITRADQLLSREQMLKHPAVILHELAHGYHDQILGFEHPAVIDAFEAAKNYQKVGKLQACVALCEHAVKRFVHESFWLLAAQTYHKLGEDEKAGTAYRNALAINPSCGDR